MISIIRDRVIREAVFHAYKGKSFYSGKAVQFDEMHVDHVVPLSRGGKDELSNFALAHPQDNLSKSCLLDEEAVVGVLYQIKVVFLPRMQKYLSGKIKANNPVDQKRKEGKEEERFIRSSAYPDPNKLRDACPDQVVHIFQLTISCDGNAREAEIIDEEGDVPRTIAYSVAS